MNVVYQAVASQALANATAGSINFAPVHPLSWQILSTISHIAIFLLLIIILFKAFLGMFHVEKLSAWIWMHVPLIVTYAIFLALTSPEVMKTMYNISRSFSSSLVRWDVMQECYLIKKLGPKDVLTPIDAVAQAIWQWTDFVEFVLKAAVVLFLTLFGLGTPMFHMYFTYPAIIATALVFIGAITHVFLYVSPAIIALGVLAVMSGAFKYAGGWLIGFGVAAMTIFPLVIPLTCFLIYAWNETVNYLTQAVTLPDWLTRGIIFFVIDFSKIPILGLTLGAFAIVWAVAIILATGVAEVVSARL